MCPGCGDEIHHRCHDTGPAALREALIALLTWKPHGVDRGIEKAIRKVGEAAGWIDKGSDFVKTPFFGGEPWTYGMFGKEDGRSVKSRIDSVIEAAGLNPHEIRAEAWKTLEEDDKERTRMATRRAEVQDERAKAIKLFRSKAPLEEKIARLDAILARKSEILNPAEKDDSGAGGWNHLYKWLREQYGDGISPTINRQRIEHCREVAFKTGVYLLSLTGSSGDGRGLAPIFAHRYQSEDDAKRVLMTKCPFDPSSEDPFKRALYARIRTNSDLGEAYVRKADGTWKHEPRKER